MKPLDFACPTCRRPAGKSCVTSERGLNGKFRTTLAHSTRVKLAEKPAYSGKCAIFYLSLNRGKDRQRIILDDKTWGYVRVQATDNADGEYGLSKAAPGADETVMNAHPLETE